MKNIFITLILSLIISMSVTAQTVVDIIVNSPEHETLETAVVAAGLAGTLSGDGPFTVFAPTDAAFAALPAGVLESLLDEPEGLLTEILLYHVVGASALSTDLSNGQMIATLNGAEVTVTIDGSNVFINDAQVIVADIEADNGVVHIIDAVLIPNLVSVDESVNPISNIFPNPANDILTVVLEKQNSNNRYVITDMNGRKVQEGLMTGLTNNIEVSALEGGVYTLTVFNSNNTKTVLFNKL